MGGLIDAAMVSSSLKPCWHKIITIYEAKPFDLSQTRPSQAATTHHYEVSPFSLIGFLIQRSSKL